MKMKRKKTDEKCEVDFVAFFVENLFENVMEPSRLCSGSIFDRFPVVSGGNSFNVFHLVVIGGGQAE